VSAVALQRVLGLGSYQTAWTCLHKLRRAMIRPGRERLAGMVEVDESYLGGEEKAISSPILRQDILPLSFHRSALTPNTRSHNTSHKEVGFPLA